MCPTNDMMMLAGWVWKGKKPPRNPLSSISSGLVTCQIQSNFDQRKSEIVSTTFDTFLLMQIKCFCEKSSSKFNRRQYKKNCLLTEYCALETTALQGCNSGHTSSNGYNWHNLILEVANQNGNTSTLHSSRKCTTVCRSVRSVNLEENSSVMKSAHGRSRGPVTLHKTEGSYTPNICFWCITHRCLSIFSKS